MLYPPLVEGLHTVHPLKAGKVPVVDVQPLTPLLTVTEGVDTDTDCVVALPPLIAEEKHAVGEDVVASVELSLLLLVVKPPA